MSALDDERSLPLTETDELTQLAHALEDWKEFLNFAQDVLLWKNMYYGGVIAGFVSVLFLLWWYLEISVLTTMAFLLFICATADFALPIIGQKLLSGGHWQREQEKQFESVCQQILDVKIALLSTWRYMRVARQEYSALYITGVCTILFSTGLIGYWINNTFLLYLLILSISLYPGLSHHGILHRLISKMKTRYLPTGSSVKDMFSGKLGPKRKIN